VHIVGHFYYCPLKFTGYYVHKIARIWGNPDEILMLFGFADLAITSWGRKG
jgi:hypothetical protein